MAHRRPTRSRLMALITSSCLVVSGLAISVLTAPSAVAEPGPVVPRTDSIVTADALPTVQVDGVVWSQAVSGNTVFAGGSFTTARPAGSAAGVNTTPRTNLLAYNLTTGALITTFNPVLNGQVQSVAMSPNGSRVYIAGDFTTVNGSAAGKVAALDATTGALVSTFKINIATRVKAIVATDSTVYVGGQFTAANGVLRDRLAAFNAANGGLLGWNPGADDNVNTLVLTPDKTKVIVGGAFKNVGAQPAYGLAALDASTGALLPWAAGSLVRNAGDNSAITSLTTDGTSIIGTGYTFGSGGNLEGTFSAEPNSGTINWVEDCHGDTYSAYSTGQTVYSVSHAHYCGNVGGFPQSDPWGTNMRHAIAWTSNATGTIGHDPLGYFDWFGNPSPSMINWFPDMTNGTFTGQGQAAWNVTGNGQYVVMGGEFPTVNGVGQQGLVRFAVKSLATNKQAPQVSGSKFNPGLLQTGAKSVRVGFLANWDRDDTTLTYKVVRNSNTAAPRYTTTADSTFWNRPMLGFVDDLPAADPVGTTYRYRLYAVDAAGNQTAGDTVTITTTDAPTLGSYASMVKSQGASTYWRLNEPSGTAAIDYSGSYNDGLASAGVTRGTAGAIIGDTDTASTFSGTATGLVTTQSPIAGPDTFTTEAWFKTTTTTGGKILGFGNLPAGTSSFGDRNIYMDNAGRIFFGVNSAGNKTVNSAKSYNDGQWHQVVSTLSPAGMLLYVDGQRVGKRVDVTTGRVLTGYWRVGGDVLTGWGSKPTSSYFNGAIDEVSIYPTALTADQVVAQYVASGRTSPLPQVPADAYGAAVYNDQPDLFWRLGESSGTVAADSSAAVNPGNYVGTSTKGVAGAIDGLADTAVTFNGSSGFVSSATPFVNPTTYSEEAWFKTSTVRGGKIIGFGNAATGLSSAYDRHVYMQNDGKVVFGTNGAAQVTVISPTAYNNNQWHHVVATQGSDGMKLYLDGQLVGSNPATGAQAYNGYWRVGGDRTWNSTSSYFAGTIDEAAVYPTVLSAARVTQHYKASGRSLTNVPPVAAFTSAAAGLKLSVDGTGSADADGTVSSYAWDFGDSSTGTGGTTDHTYTAAGTYTVALTVTDSDGGTNVVSHPVTVTNTAPVASFTSTTANLTVSVDASASTDADGTIAGYAWDFGDNSTGTGATTTHQYAAAGTYPVVLTVTDNAGGSTSTTSSVTVAVVNAAPTAAFSATTAGLTANLNGSASTDPDGSISSYAWDFGDGATGTGATVSHAYGTSGTRNVALTVTDNSGATNTITKAVTVVDPAAIATDGFGRTATSGWGTADVGGVWTLNGQAALFPVANGQGQIKMDKLGAGPLAFLNSVSATDLNASVDIALDKVPTGSGVQASVITRRVGTSDYRVKLRLQSTSTIIQVSKVVNNVETSIRTYTVPTMVYQAGDVVRLSLQVKGSGAASTVISAKAWKLGASEPTAFQTTVTDTEATLQGVAGSVGLQAYLTSSSTNAPVVASFDNLTVTAVPGA